MQKWEDLKQQIISWSKLLITDDQFYCYLLTSEFECASDRRLADIFIKQHDGGEWSHAIYHRMKVT